MIILLQLTSNQQFKHLLYIIYNTATYMLMNDFIQLSCLSATTSDSLCTLFTINNLKTPPLFMTVRAVHPSKVATI